MIKKLKAILKNIFGTKTTTVKVQPKSYRTQQQKQYAKKKLLTPTELKFYNAIKKHIPQEYILLPQINLASIITRTDEHKYQNELFRNIDFAIFDKNYMPIALIEINDKTHKEGKRIARDIKVKEICQSAELPLITFWTDYGINEEYIAKRIKEYI